MFLPSSIIARHRGKTRTKLGPLQICEGELRFDGYPPEISIRVEHIDFEGSKPMMITPWIQIQIALHVCRGWASHTFKAKV